MKKQDLSIDIHLYHEAYAIRVTIDVENVNDNKLAILFKLIHIK